MVTSQWNLPTQSLHFHFQCARTDNEPYSSWWLYPLFVAQWSHPHFPGWSGDPLWSDAAVYHAQSGTTPSYHAHIGSSCSPGSWPSSLHSTQPQPHSKPCSDPWPHTGNQPVFPSSFKWQPTWHICQFPNQCWKGIGHRSTWVSCQSPCW